MKIVVRTFFTASLFMLFAENISAQVQVLILEFHQSKRDPISFPCRPISNCIDTIFQQQDTIYIYLQETRKFYRDTITKTEVVTYTFYHFKNRKFKILIEIENHSDCNFIKLKSLDHVYILKKEKEIYKYLRKQESISEREYMNINEDGMNIRY